MKSWIVQFEKETPLSSLLIHPAEGQSQTEVWARLIPGETPSFRATLRKPPRSVTPFPIHGADVARNEKPVAPSEPLALFIPAPMQGQLAWGWLQWMAADWVLITLNWLLLGALIVLLRKLFPDAHFSQMVETVPASLLGFAVLHAALITLIGYTEGLQTEDCDLSDQTKTLGKSVLLATAVMGIAFSLQARSWAIGQLMCAAGVLHFVSLWIWRWRLADRQQKARSFPTMRNVLIVGAGPVGRRVASHIESHPAARRRICGFLDDDSPLGNGVIGHTSDLALMARKEFIDEVILSAPHNADLTQRVLREAKRLRLDLEIVPDLFGCKPVARQVERVGDMPVICLHAERLPETALILKRAVDIVGAGLALTLLSPLLAAISLLIKFDSSGPILYSAKRAGRKGQLFRCYKFRTMVTNADGLKHALRRQNERSGPIFKIANDPRITRFGHILRRYSLDELPQLWNVLKGDMSLVGPRPHPLDDVAAYEIQHLARLDVTPGITGLWQVMARRDPSFSRGMELDRQYIQTWSLKLDFQILLRTVMAVVQGSGQ